MKIIDLKIPKDLEIGDQVITSKGFTFELIDQYVWKDLTSGLIWLPPETEKYTHYKALEKFGDRLPTKEEFKIAEQHGFREVLQIKGWLWSSSVYPDSTDYAHGFGVSDNTGVGFSVSSRDLKESVRCVLRKPND